MTLREPGGDILYEFDSREFTPFGFAAEIGRNAKREECLYTVCEDVPMSVNSLFQVKPVLKLQGVIMAACNQSIDRLFFLQPSTWMAQFPGVQRVPADIGRGMTKGAKDRWRIAKAEEHATALGYTAPDLLARWKLANPGLKPLVKNTGDLKKSKTDYISAFLMSEFLRTRSIDEVRALPGCILAQI